MLGYSSNPIRASINKRLINKNETNDTNAMAYGFEAVTFTVDQLIEHIKQGHAYCAEVAGGHRTTANFVATNVISVDIDEGMTLEEVVDHPLVSSAASFIYTTCSHTSEHHRYRIVFLVDYLITNADEARALTRALSIRLSGDRRAVDPARLFYGNTEAQFIRPGQVMSLDLAVELIEQGSTSDLSETLGGTTKCVTIQGLFNKILTGADGRQAKLGDFEAGSGLHCPFHADKNPSAFVVENRQRSAKGIHCLACKQTFWPLDPATDYDFDSFEVVAKEVLDLTVRHEDTGPIVPNPDAIEGMRRAKIHFDQTRFVRDIDVLPGVTFIRSPKGTGKTKFLQRLVREHPGRVLLIGHRRTLIRSMCGLLGLNCYLEDASSYEPLGQRKTRYGVCLDSINKVKDEKPYDLIVIDESEQVLAHLLSETLDGKRNQVLQMLMKQIQRAGAVVAADADLSWNSFFFLQKWRGERNRATDTHQILINQPRMQPGTLKVMRSELQLIGDLFENVRAGNRCFLAACTKENVKKIALKLEKEFPDVRALIITADETQAKDQDVLAYIASPAVEALKYQVVLASPAVSTGLDITFPNNEQYYDVAYGLFDSHVLTHFECDQQLSRVRHPKEVKVFVTPWIQRFETDIRVVRNDVMRSSIIDHFVGETDEGQAAPVVSDRRDLLEVSTAIIAEQRASKNNLRQHFLNYKARQGWTIEIVGLDSHQHAYGSSIAGEGESLLREFRMKRLLTVDPLSPEELDRMQDRIRFFEFTSDAERARYERTMIEGFYKQSISRELIDLDNRGEYRACIERFERLNNVVGGLDVRDTIAAYSELDPRELAIHGKASAGAIVGWALSTTPFYDRCRINLDARVRKEDLGRFIEFLSHYRVAIEQVLGIQLHKDALANPITQLKKFIGMIGLELKKEGKSKFDPHIICPNARALLEQIVEDRAESKVVRQVLLALRLPSYDDWERLAA